MSEILVRLGTRSSKLAMIQADLVRSALESSTPEVTVDIVTIRTEGDRDRSTPLAAMGGAGVFVKELEQALLDERVDIGVHSAKDLPNRLEEGLNIGAVLPRGPVEDAWISRNGTTLSAFPAGAVVGTSSPRRAAQLLAIRSDLEIRPIRGNVETRLRKVHEGEYDATVLALAGLVRLGLEDVVTEVIDSRTMLPAPGQGVIAVQCREADSRLCDLLGVINNSWTMARLLAERGFMERLNAGCGAAVAGLASYRGGNLLRMKGRVLALDGLAAVEGMAIAEDGADPAELGRRVAENLLQQGADVFIPEDDEN